MGDIVAGFRTAMDQMTEERLAFEANFGALFARNPFPMWVLDVDTLRFLAVNEAAIASYGYAAEEFLQMRISDICVDGGAGLPQSGDWRLRTKDGRVLDVDIRSSRFELSDRRAAFAVAVDVTERNRAQRELARSEEQLRQRHKLEAVGQLAGGVAHDFNNLLTVILGRSQVLVTRLEHDPALLREAALISKTAARAVSLTRQLLAFSRKQVLQPKVLSLNTVVTEVDRMLRRLLGEDIELVAVLDPALRCVNADPGQIEQVIVNLAVNARDAMPQGGRLIIQTANVDLAETSPEDTRELPPGCYVTLAVQDTGCGMHAEVLARLFEPFFTTKDKGKGTGLGLSTVYGIVKQSGGDISVVSELGDGTTFRIWLPAVNASPSPEPDRPPMSLLRGDETVLLVEDDAQVRTFACEALEMQGYTVLEAASPRDALLVAGRHGGLIHLLATDVVMPQMSGRELAERLARARPEMRVLYISGYARDATTEHVIWDGHAPFLEKPFNADLLARKVREAIDTPGALRGRAASP